MPLNDNKTNLPALTVIASLFFVFGFITWSNSQLIPYLKLACELSDTQSLYVASAFFAAYFVMAIPSSWVLEKTGFKNGMSLGLIIMAIGALMFIPAAYDRNYPLFLGGLFVIGSGLAILQTAANPYATILGPIESAAQRISIMGICNKIAGILSVYILGAITLKNADYIKQSLLSMTEFDKNNELNMLAQRVVMPYVTIAIVLFSLAVVIYFLKLPEIQNNDAPTDSSTQIMQERTSILQYPHLLMGVLAIFLYVGVEVISYDTFASYGEYLGFSLDTSKNFATYTGYSLLLGYIFGIVAIPKYISQQKALSILSISSIVLILISMFTSGYIAVISFALLGFTNSVVWPALWPLAIHKLGKFTKLGSALLVMGIVGGAVLPPLYMHVAQWVASKQLAYGFMIPCYLFIIYYARSGHKLGIKF